MQIDGLAFHECERLLRKGYKAFRREWPQNIWVEMAVADNLKFVMHRDGQYDKWEPELADYARTIWSCRP